MESPCRSSRTVCVVLSIAVVVLSILLARAGKRLAEPEGSRGGHSLPVAGMMRPDSLENCGSPAEDSIGTADEVPSSLLDPCETDFLVERGLADPAGDLISDLVAHPEIIPMEPVLGGTMYFPEGSVIILSDRWAYAEFEDGHLGGSCLLEYEVDDGSVTWTILAH
jgi:hypothetical protein